MKALGLVTATVVALVGAGIVLAANPSKEKVRMTAAGRAQAKAEVVHQRDVGAGWQGGFKKPDISSTMPGCSYRPKQSDLVLNGAAETTWQKQGVEIDSEAQVLKTATMVKLDWQRTVLAPQVLPCLRKGFAKSIGTSGTVVSFGQVAFPHLTTLARGYRGVIDVKTALGKTRIEFELAVFGAGRSELTLSVTGLAAGKTALRNTELRLARRLVGRIRH